VQRGHADLGAIGVLVEGHLRQRLSVGGGDRLDPGVEAGDGDGAVLVVQARQDAGEGVNGVLDGAAVPARVKVGRGAADDEVECNQSLRGDGALVRVTRAAICGSDHWPYKSMQPSDTGRRMGHEFIGIVEAVGDDVRTLEAGDFVVAPFLWSDGTCVFCREGLHSACLHGGRYGDPDVDGGQGEAVRVPQADGTLVVLPVEEDDALMPSLLTLTDVMATGHHAALSAQVAPGKSAAVVGDGAVGLCGVIAARRLGAEQVILLGRHPTRIALATDFGATDIVSERGDEAVERVRELTDGLGAHSVLECVGLEQATVTALESCVRAAPSAGSACRRKSRSRKASRRFSTT
jgi:threonine dehydrogenase-like Zn-dependent dehydrogenase